MSERKGMKRYLEWGKSRVRERIAAGETQKRFSKGLGISRYGIQSWCGLRPETKLRQLAPMPKGGPKKNKAIELPAIFMKCAALCRLQTLSE